jgi:quercetin dioxygenase-like cupin family protein
MKELTRLAMGFCFVTVSVISLLGIAIAQDSAKVAPKSVKVILENNRVRVLEVRIKPGEKVPMHSHPAHVTYTLSDVKGKYISSDGETTVGEAKPNAVFWSEAVTHASENLGTSEIHAVVVELKESPKKKRNNQ